MGSGHEIIHIPEDTRQDIVADYLDAYLNAFYRSMKAMRRKNRLGVILQAGLSIKYLIVCLYAVNGLIQPKAT
jgi:hypothetical protein